MSVGREIEYSSGEEMIAAYRERAKRLASLRMVVPPSPEPEREPVVVLQEPIVVEPRRRSIKVVQRWPRFKPLARRYVAWDDREVKLLGRLVHAGFSAKLIARRLGRTVGSVSRRREEILKKGDGSQFLIAAAKHSEDREAVIAIVAAVASERSLRPEDISSNSKSGAIAAARMEAIWLCVRDTKLSYAEIGRIFRRDHTTVIHAVRRLNAIKGENLRGAGVKFKHSDRVRG